MNFLLKEERISRRLEFLAVRFFCYLMVHLPVKTICVSGESGIRQISIDKIKIIFVCTVIRTGLFTLEICE